MCSYTYISSGLRGHYVSWLVSIGSFHLPRLCGICVLKKKKKKDPLTLFLSLVSIKITTEKFGALCMSVLTKVIYLRYYVGTAAVEERSYLSRDLEKYTCMRKISISRESETDDDDDDDK